MLSDSELLANFKLLAMATAAYLQSPIRSPSTSPIRSFRNFENVSCRSSFRPAFKGGKTNYEALGLTAVCLALHSRRRSERSQRQFSALVALQSLPAEDSANVHISVNDEEGGKAMCHQVAESIQEAIKSRGAFALAIPGGSILNMLAAGKKELEGVDWSKGIMAYVNHKCVPNDDSAATHKKALGLFLSGWTGLKVITLSGSSDSRLEAEQYEAAMRALPTTLLPRSGGLPAFDLSLIGVGDDGHFGSLYPGRDEIIDTSGRWVLPVDKKMPPSITLSRDVVLASKKVIVASAGVSEKYPKGKSEAMRRAIEGDESLRTFPAVALRGHAQWLLDEAAASALRFVKSGH